MKRTGSWIIAAAVLMLSAACAHVPRAPEATANHAAMRARYLAENPQGAYNDHIVRGEIVKGMSVPDVFASWGTPDVMQREKENVTAESWVYISRDPHSRDFVRYEIVFEDREVTRWYMTRCTSGCGGTFASGAAGLDLQPKTRVDGSETAQIHPQGTPRK